MSVQQSAYIAGTEPGLMSLTSTVPVSVLTNGTAARLFLLTNPSGYTLTYNGLVMVAELVEREAVHLGQVLPIQGLEPGRVRLGLQGGQVLDGLRVGRAPQGLAVSLDGTRLYVSNFMDRTVGIGVVSPERALNLGFTGSQLCWQARLASPNQYCQPTINSISVGYQAVRGALRPDPSVAAQRVTFGTSGHRGRTACRRS